MQTIKKMFVSECLLTYCMMLDQIFHYSVCVPAIVSKQCSNSFENCLFFVNYVYFATFISAWFKIISLCTLVCACGRNALVLCDLDGWFQPVLALC